MATNVVELVNQALTSLNVEPINSIDEDRKSARFAKQKYEHIRDATLRMHPWNSATRRVSLTQLSETPTYGFTYVYQLPADFLRLVKINQTADIKHEVEYPRRLLTDENGVEITYIARITSVVEMDALLQDVIAARLAFELAIPLTGSVAVKDRLEGELKQKIREARMVDGLEGPVHQLVDSDWLTARHSGIAGFDPTKVISP